MKSYILTLLIFLPLLASLMMLFVPLLKEQKNNSLYRWIALIASGIQLFLVSWLYMNFDPTLSLPQNNITNQTDYVVQIPWIQSFNIEYFIGVEFKPKVISLISSIFHCRR